MVTSQTCTATPHVTRGYVLRGRLLTQRVVRFIGAVSMPLRPCTGSLHWAGMLCSRA